MTYPQPYGYPAAGPVVQTQVLVPPHRCSTAHVVIAWVLAVLTGLYLLPWAIGATRNRSNVAAIALVNLFLGWTVVGWIVALVMACGSERPVVLVSHTYAPPYVPPSAPAPTYAPGPAWSPPALEHTQVDPFSAEPTVWFPDGTRSTDRR